MIFVKITSILLSIVFREFLCFDKFYLFTNIIEHFRNSAKYIENTTYLISSNIQQFD